MGDFREKASGVLANVFLWVMLGLLVLGGLKVWEFASDWWKGPAPAPQAGQARLASQASNAGADLTEMTKRFVECGEAYKQQSAELDFCNSALATLQARLAAIAPAKASARTSDPSVVVQQGMAMADVDAILGLPRSADMTTCGSETPQGAWQCFRRRYCTPKGCVVISFQNSNAGWVVAFWGKY